jgi:hypothetical protein
VRRDVTNAALDVLCLLIEQTVVSQKKQPNRIEIQEAVSALNTIRIDTLDEVRSCVPFMSIPEGPVGMALSAIVILFIVLKKQDVDIERIDSHCFVMMLQQIWRLDGFRNTEALSSDAIEKHIDNVSKGVAK